VTALLTMSAAANKSKTLCNNIIKTGKCRFGADCRFSHDVAVPTVPEICSFYLQNACTKGASCRFSHDVDITQDDYDEEEHKFLDEFEELNELLELQHIKNRLPELMCLQFLEVSHREELGLIHAIVSDFLSSDNIATLTLATEIYGDFKLEEWTSVNDEPAEPAAADADEDDIESEFVFVREELDDKEEDEFILVRKDEDW
jgi:hypothetical protein